MQFSLHIKFSKGCAFNSLTYQKYMSYWCIDYHWCLFNYTAVVCYQQIITELFISAPLIFF